ncbi:U3 small nucleolar RNA-associated protein 6-domain-containing protein [Podospora aff. communis PSN243]|uniref:U3 small nucleolar RNA-associated protein 6-domain-containing protein n=1 Tax=Podospora aff. communis PSN243 TaxID=3040156 RepID=A0AAV9G8Q4_9PEZI|nr:U3 small nucleolar RNA-associated protein 6-domain-containing protein [Podospora aff. communis PSN243]
MAGVSDKARFYLERAAPQLREFEEKEIFKPDEIKSLVTKRSDFEHTVLAPRAKPTDFLAYVDWERSLDRLRAKRCRRLKIRTSTSHASEARTFGIFERAVLKHPGCVPLWVAYLEFAAQARATKKWRRVITRALRLHPTNAGLWIMAGQKAAKNGDMERARAHFLRGCRFCTGEATLWLEYARCEMDWLRRIEAKKGGEGVRRGGNVMEAIKATETADGEDDAIEFDESDDSEGGGEDELVLPDPDLVAGGKKKKDLFDEEITRKMEQSPALTGAIPMAIFDIATKQPFFSAEAAASFFDLFASFSKVSTHGRIAQHVLDAMEERYPSSPETCSCHIRQPLIGVGVQTAEFPKALRECLARLRTDFEKTSDKKALAQKMVVWIESILEVEGLDAAIKTVLEHTKQSMEALSK